MGLFNKSIPDEDWLRQVLPSYEAARPLGVALSDAIRQENLEGQMRAVQDVVQKSPVISDTVKRLPSPTAADAREAKKNLELALKDHADDAKQGAKLFRALAGARGQSLEQGGRLEGALALAMTASQKTMFEDIVQKGESHMDKASGFFSKVKGVGP